MALYVGSAGAWSWLHNAGAIWARLHPAQIALWAALAVATFGLAGAYAGGRRLWGRRLASELSPHVQPAELREGSRLWLRAADRPSCPSLAATCVSSQRRIIALKLDSGEMPLRPGTPVTGAMAERGASLQFTTEVIDYRAGLLYVKRPAWLTRVQRREHFRVPVTIPAVIRDSTDCARSYRGAIRDLSASGMRLAVAGRPCGDGPLTVSAPLGGDVDWSFTARVVAETEIRQSTLPVELQLELLQIGEDQRNRLVKLCLGIQQAQMRAANATERAPSGR